MVDRDAPQPDAPEPGAGEPFEEGPRQRRRNFWLTGGLTAVAVLAVIALVLAILALTGGPDDAGAPPASPTPTAASPTPIPGSPSPTAVDPRDINLDDATVRLPGWPDADTRRHCQAGLVGFEEGVAPALGRWRYWINFTGDPRYGDLDGEPGEEIVTSIACGAPNSEAVVVMLGLRPTADGALRTMGYVHGEGDYEGSALRARIDDGRVSVDLQRGLGPGADEQTRVYEWRDDSFVQVDGPTQFPA